MSIVCFSFVSRLHFQFDILFDVQLVVTWPGSSSFSYQSLHPTCPHKISMGKRAPALRKQSHARLNVLKYIIYGMYLSGDTVSDICSEVVKPDGASPSGVAVRSAIAFVVARGGIAFAGSLKHPGGRPRATSTTLDRKIIKTVFKYRGKAKVTVEFLQKVIRGAPSQKSSLTRPHSFKGWMPISRRRAPIVKILC